MITKIAIESFKSLERVEVELGRVNVFIGANGSGKSNLLEAIGVLSAAAGGRVDDEALLRRGVRPGVPKLYKCALKGAHQTPHIVFSARNCPCKTTGCVCSPSPAPIPGARTSAAWCSMKSSSPWPERTGLSPVCG